MKSGYFSKSILLLGLLASFGFLHAQKLDEAAVKELISSKQFVFKAQTAFPLGGASRQLTTEYDITVAGDSLVSYLPYFGRAYSAPFPSDSGIRFTSTNYEYRSIAKKKGSWEIIMEPHDTREVRQLVLSISSSGFGNLQVNSNNRQSISFSGYIIAK